MATFSVNQVKQMYVCNKASYKNGNITFNADDPLGTMLISKDPSETKGWFNVKTPGGIVRSDIIDEFQSVSTVTPASAMRQYLRVGYVELDPDVNSGNPVAGQDYLLRISFNNYIGISDEDQYFKYGMVHAYYGMNPDEFYKVMVQSLIQNFSRENNKLLEFGFYTNNNFYLVNHKNSHLNYSLDESPEDGSTNEFSYLSLDALVNAIDETGETIEAIVIMEAKPTDWSRGTYADTPVNFSLSTDSIISNGDERIWGITGVSDTSQNGNIAFIDRELDSKEYYIGNGHKTADLEYFCMGERGDQYRNIGWPNVIKTNYMVNPDLEYHYVNIHYWFTDTNESVQKSEKDIIIAIPTDSVCNTLDIFEQGGTMSGVFNCFSGITHLFEAY